MTLIVHPPKMGNSHDLGKRDFYIIEHILYRSTGKKRIIKSIFYIRDRPVRPQRIAFIVSLWMLDFSHQFQT